MLLVIFACFAVQVALAAPPVAEVLGGFIPRAEVVTNPAALYIAIGIIGATVMPHNLYLHSSIVQTRDYPRNDAGKRMAIRSEEHTSELQSLMRISYAVFCLKKKKNNTE